MTDVHLPDYFYNQLVSLQSKLPSIKSKQLLASVAIDSFTEKLNKLSVAQLRDYNKELLKLCKSWVERGILSENTRGVKGRA